MLLPSSLAFQSGLLCRDFHPILSTVFSESFQFSFCLGFYPFPFPVTISYYRTPSPVHICSDIILTLFTKHCNLQNNEKSQANKYWLTKHTLSFLEYLLL